MNLRETKRVVVVGLSDDALARLDAVAEQYGLRGRTAAVKHVVRNVARVLGDMRVSLRHCAGCRPLTADERTASVILMLTAREKARLRRAVGDLGVSDLTELIEGSLALFHVN